MADNPATKMGKEDEAARARLASEIVSEALEGYEHLITPEIEVLLRAVLEGDLLLTPEGQATLRSAMEAPVLAKSDTIAKDTGAAGAETESAAKRGGSKSR